MDHDLAKAAAEAIAANAKMIAKDTNDWPDAIWSRISAIENDLQKLKQAMTRR